jgi:hypothetical protein
LIGNIFFGSWKKPQYARIISSLAHQKLHGPKFPLNEMKIVAVARNLRTGDKKMQLLENQYGVTLRKILAPIDRT